MKSPAKENPYLRYGWVIQGLSWGAFMFVFMGIVYPLAVGDGLTARAIGKSLVVWALGGLLFGLTMRGFTALVLARKQRRDRHAGD